MKKIIVGILSLFMLFAGQGVSASSFWNGASNDCPTINVANATTGAGWGNPCWTGTNIQVQPGQTINVRIYYHNTGTVTATNTHIKLDAQTSSSTSHTFKAHITSPQGNLDSGNVYVTIPSAQSLSFGQVVWYTENTNQTVTPLLNGQDGSEILNSPGLYIGNIAPGWATQGSVVVSFHVSNNQPQSCSIDNFSANPSSINSGNSSTLSWNTSDCSTVKLNNSTVALDGSQTVWPTTTTTYTLKAYNSNGTLADTATATVTVNTSSPICSINSFSANPTSITQGQSSTLNWNTTNCTSVKLNGNNVNLDGSQVVSPSYTTTYTLTASNTNSSDGDSVTVNVSQPAQMTGSIHANHQTCSIAPNQSTCAVTLIWSTINPVSTSEVTHDGSTIATGNNGSKLVNVEYGSQNYYLYNNGIELDSETVTASCTSGYSWNGSKCAPIIVSSCTINYFTATPSTITKGDSSTLSWGTSNCSYTKISAGAISQSNNYGTTGTLSVSPTQTTTFTLTAYGSNGSTTSKSVTVTVKTQSQMTGQIGANPDDCVIAQGQSTCASELSWSTQNPVGTSAVTHNGSTIATGNTGSKTVNVSYGTQTYYLYNSGILLDQDSVIATCAAGSSWNGSYCKKAAVYDCRISEFFANPSSIEQGESSTIGWSVANCDHVTLDGAEVNVQGERIVSPNQTTTYTLKAYETSSNTSNFVTRQVTVFVNNNIDACFINYFFGDPSSIDDGDSSVLKWDTTGCTSVKLDGSTVATSGTKTIWPGSTTTYTLTAKNSYGDVTEKTTVHVNESNDNCRIVNFDASDTSINEGDYSTLEWDTEDCSSVKISSIGTVNDDGTKKVYPTSDKTYVLTAYNDDGSTETASVKIYVDEDSNNDDECTIDSFTASDTYVDEGDEVTLRWRTTGCDDEVYITNVGDVDEDGSEDVYPYRTTTYTLRARGNGDSDSDSIKVTVGDSYGGGTVNANVVTTVATNVSQTSAQLNGLLTGSSYGNANTYFEYGTSVYLGSRTSSRTVGINNSFSDYVSGLSANTIYYFRAVSEGSNGVSYGSIEIFKTSGYATTYVNTGTTKVIREVVNQGTTVVGAESPVVLRIENRYQMIGVGDTIDYVVFYKNISNSRLSNPMVQVYIPKGITLTNYSAGSYSEDNRTLSVPLNDLYPDEEGVIYLEGRVDSLDSNLAQMVTTAILIYTTPNGAQENAMAYVLNNPRLTNLLGASAFGTGLFLGMNLIGWLLLITFILLLILLVRTFYTRRETVVSTIHHQ